MLMIIKNKKDKINLIKVNVLCNTLTNPILNLIIILFNMYKYLIILELLVVISEALIYYKVGKLSKQESLLVSVILNSMSYLVGLVIKI